MQWQTSKPLPRNQCLRRPAPVLQAAAEPATENKTLNDSRSGIQN
jgi:hypothetical protein